ncbi:hypothetical protein KIN20_019275 [Parelaphostrongylus tenuis]|uniref:Uncharacterized protein n=1 Tax=Parelaphostrongylus tenuis TaxID=148309 RepID=A0AAD5N5C0_PARTN|nr:hypothetical protein KIN20_019275 [Parelaphostrongylus tenuis]
MSTHYVDGINLITSGEESSRHRAGRAFEENAELSTMNDIYQMSKQLIACDRTSSHSKTTRQHVERKKKTLDYCIAFYDSIITKETEVRERTHPGTGRSAVVTPLITRTPQKTHALFDAAVNQQGFSFPRE